MKIKNILSIIILLSLSTMVNATTDTSLIHIGGDDYDWRGGESKFNSLLTAIPYQRTIGSQTTDLLIQDLDGDGTTEIIYLDGSTLRTYHFENQALTNDLSYTLPHTTNSNPAIGQLDSDSYYEITILDETDNRVIVLEYNGTEIRNQTSFSLGWSTSSSHIECEDKICAGTATVTGSIILRGFTFNESQVFNYVDLRNLGAASVCFDNRQAPFIDKRMYWSMFNKGSNTMRIGYFDVNSSNQIYTSGYIGIGSLPAAVAGGCGALSQYSGMTVADITQDHSGKEIMVGMASGGVVEEYKLRVYNSIFTEIITAPSLDVLEGQYISQPFVLDIFPVISGELEACLGAHNSSGDGTVEILCYSNDKPTGIFIGTASNIFTWNKPYSIANVSSYSISNNMYGIDILPSENYEQVLSSYGTLDLDPDSCSVLGECDMTSSYIFPIAANEDKYVISIDVQQSDQQDLISIGTTKLTYFDDNLENNPAYIDGSQSSFNPCIEGVIKVNESMLVTVVPIDPELNDVSARMQVYYGGVNEQDSGWLTNASSGTPFSSIFVLNKTVNSGQILISVRDVEKNFDTIVTSLHTFTVASQGLEFGDCETFFGTDPPDTNLTPDPNPIVTTTPNNAIRTATSTFATMSGLSEVIIWIILMGFVMYAIITVETISSGVKMYALVAVLFFGIVIGAMLEIISVSIIIISVILIALAASIAFTLMIGGGK